MPCNKWIENVANGNTFVDVGGLWGTVNERVTAAVKSGALSTTMIDMQPEGNYLWEAFYGRCRENGVICDKSIVANLDDPLFPSQVGMFDVVHCSGIIYHCPNPLYTISQLARITRKYLIVASSVIPTTINNSEGSISLEDNSALFAPAMTDKQKKIVNRYFAEVGANDIFSEQLRYSLIEDDDDSIYSPWWYLFTPNYFSGLLKVCGAEIVDSAYEWGGRTAYFLAKFDKD